MSHEETCLLLVIVGVIYLLFSYPKQDKLDVKDDDDKHLGI